MARSFSSARLLFAPAADAMSNTIARRGYSAAARGAMQVTRAGVATRSGAAAVKKTGEEEMARADGHVSWAPDPRTGYYRPENCIKEIDVAELRAELLRQNE